MDYPNFRPNNAHDFSSDGIEFVNSDGEVVVDDDDDNEDDIESNSNEITHRSPKHELQIMYIQMEFCEKSTLRLVAIIVFFLFHEKT